MFKQFFINKYFQKLSNTKFFRNDENAIIGKAKDIIKNLQDQIYYVENPHNDIDEENRDFIVEEANSLIEEIQKEYPKVDIKLTNEEKYTIVEISTKVNIITPGLNRVLGNPYIVKVERKIPNVEDKQ